MLRIGVRAGLTPSEIWQLTWFEFRCVADALRDSQLHDFDVMRHEASLNLMAHVDKKHRKQILPTKLFPLPTDKQISDVHRKLSEEEAINIIDNMTRRLINLEEVN